jgi:hypothetical protein
LLPSICPLTCSFCACFSSSGNDPTFRDYETVHRVGLAKR